MMFEKEPGLAFCSIALQKTWYQHLLHFTFAQIWTGQCGSILYFTVVSIYVMVIPSPYHHTKTFSYGKNVLQVLPQKSQLTNLLVNRRFITMNWKRDQTIYADVLTNTVKLSNNFLSIYVAI